MFDHTGILVSDSARSFRSIRMRAPYLLDPDGDTVEAIFRKA